MSDASSSSSSRAEPANPDAADPTTTPDRLADEKGGNGKESDAKKRDVFYDDELSGKAYDGRLLKRLVGYLRPHTGLLWVCIGLTILLAVVAVYWPYLLGQFIDGPFRDYLKAGPNASDATLSALESRLYEFVAIFAGYLALQFFAQTTYTYLTGALGQRTVYDLRVQLFTHLQRLPLGYFDRNPVGRLVTRVTSDIEALAELFTSGIVALGADLLRIFVIFVVMFYIDVDLALVVLGITPIMLFTSWYFGNRMRRAFRETRKRIAAVNAFLQEAVSGMSLIQSFRQEQKADTSLDDRNQAHYDAQLETIFNFALFAPTIQLFANLAIAGLLFVGGMKLIEASQLSDGSMIASAFTVGGFTTFYFWSKKLFEPIRELSEKYNILQGAMASSERIFRILDTPATILDPPAERRVDVTEPIQGRITFENVSFAYRTPQTHEGVTEPEWILKDVSFDAKPGQTIALVGATGSGKTTITNLIPRFYDIQKGRILVDGVDVRDYAVPDLRSQIAIVLQDVFLFSGTIQDNIRLGSGEIDEARVKSVAERLGAASFIEKLPHQYQQDVMERGLTLSTGQRQLVAFARALAFDPRLLILDEATANIDTESEILVQKALQTLLEGRTSIIVAHRLSTIQSADQILVLHKGEIRERGTHEELLAQNGIYAKLYALQYQGQSA